MFRNLFPLILASKSPRRQQMLAGLGISFTVNAVPIDETPVGGEDPSVYVQRMAMEKARNSADSEIGWILAADTIVVLDGRILGKPRDEHEAFSMLKDLAGECHTVYTAFALLNKGMRLSRVVSDNSLVQLARCPDSVIRAYIATGESLDKAGSYAVQGIGAFLVEKITGAYSTVVGLPLHLLVPLLLELGIVDVVPAD